MMLAAVLLLPLTAACRWTDQESGATVHQFKQEELEFVGELSGFCSRTALKCLYLARMDGPDILCSVHNLHELSQNGLKIYFIYSFKK